eukprot:NODE_728_length_4760_cov_0.305299.p3 type:complete len:138 gc:universal NODE_728_length_4760_cov_0.305299:1983-1570(-)
MNELNTLLLIRLSIVAYHLLGKDLQKLFNAHMSDGNFPGMATLIKLYPNPVVMSIAPYMITHNTHLSIKKYGISIEEIIRDKQAADDLNGTNWHRKQPLDRDIDPLFVNIHKFIEKVPKPRLRIDSMTKCLNLRCKT